MLLTKCGNDNKIPAQGSTNHIQKRVSSVCIVNDAVLRESASLASDRITSISLGDRIDWLGIIAADSSKEHLEYYKVQLSDSTIGWTAGSNIAPNADPAVIVEQTFLFRRPDLLTVTDTQFEPMDFAAILETDADWLHVIGESRRRNGWIRRSVASLRSEDVAVGILAARAARIKDSKKREQALLQIIENQAFANSSFIPKLVALLNEQEKNH
jgi:hypothetical protein